MYISRSKFTTFVEVQMSEKCDMRNAKEIAKVSREISEVSLNCEEVKWIMNHYSKLRSHWGVGGYNIDIQSTK